MPNFLTYQLPDSFMEAIMINPIPRILVPTDLSDFSDLALEYALLFQKKLGSQITLMYAEEFTFLFAGEYPINNYFQDVSEMKKHTSKLVRDYVKEHVPSTCPVATMIVDETPPRAIVITANDVNADLIIMGTHGRHGIRHALLGSVTERVLRETEHRVMTVLPKGTPANGGVTIGTILCPVNFTEVAREALKSAGAIAEALHAQLIVMNVAEDETDEARLKVWCEPLVPAQTAYKQITVNGDAAARVLEAANQLGADLIVIGAQHKFFSDATVIGTTTELITRFARQPVLTVVRAAVAESQTEKAELVAVG